jgi:phospholipase C
MLDALTANPEVWSKTALFLMYDENDGFFDHMVPPTPPSDRTQGLSTVPTTNELFQGNADYAPGPYGLGVRVPMVVISPWSKGGWVNSEVFDHTSLIRFIEQRFARECPGLVEANITPWRRAVVGDLTSAFDFSAADATLVSLPSTASYAPPDRDLHPDYAPLPPSVQQLPKQEPGVRPARALPYELDVVGRADWTRGAVVLAFHNLGRAAVVFQVRPGSGTEGPWTYTLGAGAQLHESWALRERGQRSYDLSVYGPNGFFRAFKGGLTLPEQANLRVNSRYGAEPSLILEIENLSASRADLKIHDAYTRRTTTHSIASGRTLSVEHALHGSHGWYDLTLSVDADPGFQQRLAGHVENGRPSVSDPMLGV